MNKFDQHIKDKLNQPQSPPIDAWNKIEKELVAPKKNKKRPILIWISTAAASIIFIGGIYILNDHQYNHLKSSDFVKKAPLQQSKNSLKITKENSNTIFSDKVASHSESQSIKHQVVTTKSIDNEEINRTKWLKFTDIQHKNILSSKLDEFFDHNKIKFSNDSLYLTKNNYEFLEKSFKTSDDSIFKNNNSEIEESVILEPSIESIIATNEKKLELKEPKKQSKFLVSTFASPIKMIDEQSILSNNFNSHSIQNNITLAYGAKLTYAINDNIKVRTGVSKIGLDQITNHVTTSSVATVSIASSSFQPLTAPTNTNNHIRYTSDKTVLTNAQNFPNVYYNEANNKMNHQLEFVEIPVELEYQFFNKNKFNVAAIVGGSYYLLSKNELFLTNNNQQREKIGSATNVNKSSISTNAAIKVEYQLGDKIKLQLEPTYRFMLNQVKDVNQNKASLIGMNLGLALDLK